MSINFSACQLNFILLSYEGKINNLASELQYTQSVHQV